MIKQVAIAALIAAQVMVAPQPAFAATLDPAPAEASRAGAGAFAGARLRLRMGGKSRASAGFALAPMQRSLDGVAIGFRTGEGLEYGFSGRSARPMLSLAGMPAARALQLQNGDKEDDGGISPVLLILGGVVVAGVLAYVVTKNALDCDSGCE